MHARTPKSTYSTLTYRTLFKLQRLCLAVHTLDAAQGLQSLGQGHNLGSFGPLFGPLSFGKGNYSVLLSKGPEAFCGLQKSFGGY